MNPYDFRTPEEKMFDELCERHKGFHTTPELADCELCQAELEEQDALERELNDDDG